MVSGVALLVDMLAIQSHYSARPHSAGSARALCGGRFADPGVPDLQPVVASHVLGSFVGAYGMYVCMHACFYVCIYAYLNGRGCIYVCMYYVDMNFSHMRNVCMYLYKRYVNEYIEVYVCMK